ncbi:MAG: bifunctional alpha/beta hydrolase/OsmC family protein [Parvularculaceae bacterium]
MAKLANAKVSFPGSAGNLLAAALEAPPGRPRAYALFAHCFSCSKDVRAARFVSEALRREGFAVLRFDFTGLGQSEGDFSNTNFSSNVGDLTAAAKFLEESYEAPELLVGHSLGGAAAIVAASAMPSVKAVAAIAAPAEAGHVLSHFHLREDEIRNSEGAVVTLGGREFRITKQFLDDISKQNVEAAAAALKRPLLLLHSPRDEVVGIENAGRLFAAAKHPKSFISLEGADHLLNGKADALYAGRAIAAWAARYLELDLDHGRGELEPSDGVVAYSSDAGRFTTVARASGHQWIIDAGLEDGGDGYGPNPTKVAEAALAACGVMTVKMYAERKKWPLERVAIRVRPDPDAKDQDAHALKSVIKELSAEGPLDEAQKARLLEIADKCPVHRMLTEGVRVVSRLR